MSKRQSIVKRNSNDLTRKELIQILAVAKVPAKPNCVCPVIRLAGLNLSGIDFSGMNLTAIDFSRSIMRGCRFAYAKVWACDFYSADLRDTDWRGALVSSDFEETESNFSNTDLRGSNWHGVNASNNQFETANFSGADLRDANFEDCHCFDAIFTNARLSGSSWKGAALLSTSGIHVAAERRRVNIDTIPRD